jgi:hypothetical protein
VLGDAGEASLAKDVVDALPRATRSVQWQIGENPTISVPVGYALSYVPGWWLHGRYCEGTSTEKRMDLILIILILVLLFGGGFGYRRWGYGGGIGIGGILLIVLVIYLLLGRGRF